MRLRAGYYELRCRTDPQQACRDTWWDAADARLPHFAQALRWAQALSARMGKPHLWWQVPVGNLGLPNTPGRWKDNRVETLMARPAEVARAHGLGVAFGEGAGDQTTPQQDDGVLYRLVQALASAGGQPACP